MNKDNVLTHFAVLERVISAENPKCELIMACLNREVSRKDSWVAAALGVYNSFDTLKEIAIEFWNADFLEME